jgi:hypothetical protein
VELVWAHSQCVHTQKGKCPLLIFGKQLADALNEFFWEEDWGCVEPIETQTAQVFALFARRNRRPVLSST